LRALIALLPGDGIGPEVVAEGVLVLEAVAARQGHRFDFEVGLIGGAAIDQTGAPLPAETLALCRRSEAVLLGAVGGPKWESSSEVRPEQGLLQLRKELNLFANLRPVSPYPELLASSPLKPELLSHVDLLIVRELTGGLYFGEKRREGDRAFDTCLYTEREIVRIVRVAAELASSRRKKLTSVDKANVLETSRLWRATTERVVREEYPAIELEHLLVDSAAMHLIQRPSSFDVLVTENMFGDILSDEASVLAGSLGMIPSASLGEGRRGLYEPIHGSAPSLAGRGIANPYATILSVAMLLRHSLELPSEAEAVEKAVAGAVSRKVLTPDACPAGVKPATTRGAGEAVLEGLR